ncbi:hypothetical protein E4U21_001322 [Claviceps maximensis]|nr:hypothetical protein E4U21_001322 [Claviceps maximensis]
MDIAIFAIVDEEGRARTHSHFYALPRVGVARPFLVKSAHDHSHGDDRHLLADMAL